LTTDPLVVHTSGATYALAGSSRPKSGSQHCCILASKPRQIFSGLSYPRPFTGVVALLGSPPEVSHTRAAVSWLREQVLLTTAAFGTNVRIWGKRRETLIARIEPGSTSPHIYPAGISRRYIDKSLNHVWLRKHSRSLRRVCKE